MSSQSFSDMDSGPPAKDAGIFGLECSYQQSELVIVPVPWEPTTSYGRGTALAPEAVLKASHQLDLEDPYAGDVYNKGIHMLALSSEVQKWNKQASLLTAQLRDEELSEDERQKNIAQVNRLSNCLNSWLYSQCAKVIADNKKVAILGGDHSSPYGLMKAVAEKYKDFGVLHFDAHYDFRRAYENFTFSHASIMYNMISDIPQVTKLVQVGIRDYCFSERKFQEENCARVKTLLQEIFLGEKHWVRTFLQLLMIL